MRVRLLASFVTLLFAASPLATAVCDAICAQQASAHHAGQGHACCHDEQTAGAAMHPVSLTVCGAPMADSVSAARRLLDDGRSVLLTSVAADDVPAIAVTQSTVVHAAPHLPTISHTASQLRI